MRIAVLQACLCRQLCLALPAILASALLTGCPRPAVNGEDQPPAATDAAAAPAAGAVELPDSAPDAGTIAYIGNFRGFQKPCGCAIRQSGGLLRLSTAIQYLRTSLQQSPAVDKVDAATSAPVEPPPSLPLPQPLWLIECGNFASPETRFPALRARTHLEVLAHLGTSGASAAVPGSAELQLAPDQALKALADSPIPLVSCNLRSRLAELNLEPYVELAPQWYVTGVSSWSPAVGEPPADRWWELEDPVAAVRDIAGSLPPESKIVVVATYQSGEVIHALARLPVTLIIGHGSASDKQWQAEWAAGHPNPPARGLAVKLLSISEQEPGAAPDVIAWEMPLDEGWVDDPQVAKLVAAEAQQVREQIRQRQPAGGSEGWREIEWGSSDQYLPDPAARHERYVASPPVYVGSRSCAECHPGPYEVWQESGHARALISLMQKGEQETLDCLECHVAGLLEISGYNPDGPREAVAAVSCESCHGPGSVHVGLESLGRTAEEVAIERGSTALCIGCHDSYNSPEFSAQEYWKEVGH